WRMADTGIGASPRGNCDLLYVAAGALSRRRVSYWRTRPGNGAALLVSRNFARRSSGRPRLRRSSAGICRTCLMGDASDATADTGPFVGQGATLRASESDTLQVVKAKILIIEDEPAISDNIQFVLESEGLETVRVA